MSPRGRHRIPDAKVVAFGTYNREAYPRVDVLLVGLERIGLLVGEVNAPLGYSTAQRVEALTRPLSLLCLIPVLLGRWWALIKGAWRMRATGVDPRVVVVPHLGHLDVLLARIIFPGRTIVLDYLIGLEETVADRRGASWMGGVARVLDRWALAAADLVLVDTEERAGISSHSVVVPVGATDEWFDVADGQPIRYPPQLVFFGHFTPLQGTPVIARALSLLAREGIAVEGTMIGTGQDHEIARRLAGTLPGVEWVDWVEYERLPSLVASHDVALGIFGASEKALGVVPTKVYQSMAAGLPVVTSDTEPQRRAIGAGGIFVEPGNPVALAGALRDVLSGGVEGLRFHARLAAEEFRPERVVEGLVASLSTGTH